MHSITAESAICSARNLITSLLPKTDPPGASRLTIARDLLDMAIGWEHEAEQYEDSRATLEERIDELEVAVAALADPPTAGAPAAGAPAAGAPAAGAPAAGAPAAGAPAAGAPAAGAPAAGAPAAGAPAAGAPDHIDLCESCSARAEANADLDGEIIELCDDCGRKLRDAADSVHVDQSPEYVDHPYEMHPEA